MTALPLVPHPVIYRNLQSIWRKCKRLAEFLFYLAYDYYCLSTKKKLNKSGEDGQVACAAVLQLGLLGDYVLWRPYGRSLVDRLKENGARPVVIVSATCSAIAAADFADCQRVSIDSRSWLRDLSYRRGMLRSLRSLSVKATYNMVYPRYGALDDAIVRALGAPAFGTAETASDRPSIDVHAANRLYQGVLSHMSTEHQVERHARFLSACDAALNENGHKLAKPPLPQWFLGRLSTDVQPYYVLAPGASSTRRQWPVKRFIEVALRLRTLYPKWLCVIVGTDTERHLGMQIQQALSNDNAIDLTGLTSVVELFAVVANARFALANDSAMPHIAATFSVPSIAIVGGGHYGRFLPYSSGIRLDESPTTVADRMHCFGCGWSCIYATEANHSFPCIDVLSVDMVWQELEGRLIKRMSSAGNAN